MLRKRFKKCHVCKEQIRSDSNKCTYCESYQSKRMRIAVFLSPMISTFVAVFALLISLWPHIDDVLFDKKADLFIEILSVQNGIVQLLVRNEGNKTGVLSNITFDFEMTNEGACKNMVLDFVDTRIIKAGEEKIVKTKYNELLPSETTSDPLSAQERSQLELVKDVKPTLGKLFEEMSLNFRKFTTVCDISVNSISSNTFIAIEESSFNCNYFGGEEP